MAAETTTPLSQLALTDGERALSRRTRRSLTTVTVLVVGCVMTGALTWAVRSENVHTEHRLLQVQAQQAGDVLVATVPATVAPLSTVAELVDQTGAMASFTRYMRGRVAMPGGYVVAQLWTVTDGHVVVRATVAKPGHVPGIRADSRVALAFARLAIASPTFVVKLLPGSPERLAYAYELDGSKDRDVVYVERDLPANRRARVASNSAFSDIHYAIYLGRSRASSHLLATDFPSFPVSGDTVTVAVPYGDSVLTLVAGPDGSLAGALADDLAWVLAAVGLALTIGAALAAQRIVHRRRVAEIDAARSRRLSTELGRLYAEQRAISETLQRSLLPLRIPVIPNLETAVRYVAGSGGAEVGGDWYSIVSIDERRFGFVVGDVSGHGIGAAAVMAGLRFTIRTLVLEGHDPDVVLERCAVQVRDLMRDRFATVLVGVGDLDRHEVTLANAGHLPPLLLGPEGTAAYAPTVAGLPLGVLDRPYARTTIPTPPGTTLLAFTDGLVERRREHLDVGLERLRRAALAAGPSLSTLLPAVIAELVGDDAEDDVALLALRFT